MLRGRQRSFFPGSRCVIVGASHEHRGQLCIVLALSKKSKRWCCALRDSTQTECDDVELLFESYFAPTRSHAPGLPASLCMSASAGGLGIFAASAIDAHTKVFDDPVNMMVRRTMNGKSTGVPCLALYDAAKHAADKGALEAFDALTSGDLLERCRTDARRIMELRMSATLSVAEREALLNDAGFCEREVRRIGGCLARWRANGHDFRLRGEAEAVSAVHGHTMRLQHSCEPNAEQQISDETGNLVVVTRRRIEAGELVTIDYSGGAVRSLPLAKRRELLRDRGFECACSRCVREEGGRAPGEHEQQQQQCAPSPARPSPLIVAGQSKLLRLVRREGHTAWTFVDL